MIKKLENISDADSDVLADYVLALVKTDEPTHIAKSACVENLRDFIADNSQAFVNELFTAIDTKSYDPSRPAPRSPLKSGLTDTANKSSTKHDAPRRQVNGSRKRGYHDWDRETGQDGSGASFEYGNRPQKQPRRGGRGGGDRRGPNTPIGAPRFGVSGLSSNEQQQALLQMPPFDPNDPVAAFMAMQQMMSMMPGGMAALAGALPSQPDGRLGRSRNNQRCIDYDTKGFCARGATCPYEHGNEQAFQTQSNSEYDPNLAGLLHIQPNRTGVIDSSPGERPRGGHRSRGRGHTNPRGGGKRTEISQHGPPHDSDATTIVVEQIPEDKLEVAAIEEFFGHFGTIEDVQIQPKKQSAIVKFDKHESAKSAYDSPKVVFDNRFVKVFWYKSQTRARASKGGSTAWGPAHASSNEIEMEGSEPILDPAEVAKRQEEAQRKFDEAKRKREEQQKQKQDLDAKLKTIEAERHKMAAMLAHKTGSEPPPPPEAEGPSTTASNPETEGLRAQLAILEAEAKSLGIDPDAPEGTPSWSGFPSRGRGRGAFRGRGNRGGYNSVHRGGWAGGAVKRLDNRPKAVSLTFLDGNYEDHDEELRQWLLFNSSEAASLTQHPTQKNVAVLSFPERYLGEVFMQAASAADFPMAGKFELAWYRPETSNSTESEVQSSGKEQSLPAESQTKEVGSSVGASVAAKDVNYDVAVDDDLWG